LPYSTLPLLVMTPWLPIHALPVIIDHASTLHDLLTRTINLSPVFVGAVLLMLGTMVLQPFVLSLIPVLANNWLLGTYFGFYYLVQSSGAVIGNLAIGAAFDAGARLGFQSFPWLLLLGFGLTSAASITALDRKGIKAHAWGVSRLANMTEARS
jgi:hypothetical protein